LCVQAFNGHRGAVTGLAFRQGTQQLMSSSLDRTIKLWSVEDRSYIDTLYGHQSDVIAIDCLRQERILTAGRDRTLRLWKVGFYATYTSLYLSALCWIGILGSSVVAFTAVEPEFFSTLVAGLLKTPVAYRVIGVWVLEFSTSFGDAGCVLYDRFPRSHHLCLEATRRTLKAAVL
jgi:hypothetical protein